VDLGGHHGSEEHKEEMNSQKGKGVEGRPLYLRERKKILGDFETNSGKRLKKIC
jgi:hypothetical protein